MTYTGAITNTLIIGQKQAFKPIRSKVRSFVTNCIKELNSKAKQTVIYTDEQLRLLKERCDFKIEYTYEDGYVKVWRRESENNI